MDTRKCDKCDEVMIEGYVPDTNNFSQQQLWVEVPPAVGWFWQKAKARFAVVAYRCPKCGKLEFYAGP